MLNFAGDNRSQFQPLLFEIGFTPIRDRFVCGDRMPPDPRVR